MNDGSANFCSRRQTSLFKLSDDEEVDARGDEAEGSEMKVD